MEFFASIIVPEPLDPWFPNIQMPQRLLPVLYMLKVVDIIVIGQQYPHTSLVSTFLALDAQSLIWTGSFTNHQKLAHDPLMVPNQQSENLCFSEGKRRLHDPNMLLYGKPAVQYLS